MSSPSHRVWLITGVSSGLGRELSKAALDCGDVVYGTVRTQAQAEDYERVRPAHARAVLIDMRASEDSFRAVVDGIVREAGRIDVSVNNAGYGLLGGVEEVSEAEYRDQFETNFFGVLKAVRAVLPHMRAAGSGTIVNVASVAGFKGAAGMSLYCASKHALVGLSESLTAELGPLGIQVTVVCPGNFRTEFAGRSLRRPGVTIEAYATTRSAARHLEDLDGHQPGSPQRAAQAILAALAHPLPPRIILGSDAVSALVARVEADSCVLAQQRIAACATDI